MTEQEWLACTDPTPMLEFLQGKAGDRKLRLFACACCRRIWHLLDDERGRRAVEVAERYADGVATRQQVVDVLSSWGGLYEGPPVVLWDSWKAASCSSEYGGGLACCPHGEWLAMAESVGKDEQECQSHLLHDLFGPVLFRPLPLDPSWPAWNDNTVVKLAEAIYEERAFDRLPILADALEEAGCTETDLLAHCRQPGEHVRGCWVVDLILGKK